MIRIGLIGEDPTDTSAIRNLLQPALGRKAQLVPVLKNVKGDQLEANEKFARMLAAELKTDRKDIYVFIRDADAIATEGDRKRRRDWYSRHAQNIRQPHLLLLIIFELEALIFADIETFNRLYGTDIKVGRDVTMIKEPKEELKRLTPAPNRNKKFEESHCPQIFSELNLATVQNRCAYFKAFVVELNELITEI